MVSFIVAVRISPMQVIHLVGAMDCAMGLWWQKHVDWCFRSDDLEPCRDFVFVGNGPTSDRLRSIYYSH